ncbi:MAG: hypothetical protein MUC28_04115 [Planctomycetes bacterium]|nr:hypothetical protein [Planctomycetota bacterium]
MSRRVKITAALLVLCLAAAIWFVFYSNFFTVKTIEARGEGRVDPAELEKLAYDQADRTFFVLWPENNLFLYDIPMLQNELNRKYSFSNLSIYRKLPSTLIIDYLEKSYALIWQEHEKYYYADERGSIIEEVPAVEAKEKNYPLIENLSDQGFKDRQAPVSEDYLSAVFIIYAKFKDNQTEELTLKSFKYDQEINTVKAALIDGPDLYFNMVEDLDKQFNKLITIKNERIKNDFSKKTYIDLRYGDRVYYR